MAPIGGASNSVELPHVLDDVPYVTGNSDNAHSELLGDQNHSQELPCDSTPINLQPVESPLISPAVDQASIGTDQDVIDNDTHFVRRSSRQSKKTTFYGVKN